MKVRVDFTVDVDAVVVREYMGEMGCGDETIADFVRSFLTCPEILDESIGNSTGATHITRIIRRK
jgi:hypothetical protein